MAEHPENRTLDIPRDTVTVQSSRSLPVMETPPADAGYVPGRPKQSSFSVWKPYLLGALIAGFILVLVYQQMQIVQLSNELGLVSDDIRRNDVRSRLMSVEEKLQQVDTRIAYLDTKITAVDQKAQTSLNKWREQENRPNFVMDAWKRITESLGFGQ